MFKKTRLEGCDLGKAVKSRARERKEFRKNLARIRTETGRGFPRHESSNKQRSMGTKVREGDSLGRKRRASGVAPNPSTIKKKPATRSSVEMCQGRADGVTDGISERSNLGK